MTCFSYPIVHKIDDDGDACIEFDGIGRHWVKQRSFCNISIISHSVSDIFSGKHTENVCLLLKISVYC